MQMLYEHEVVYNYFEEPLRIHGCDAILAFLKAHVLSCWSSQISVK